MSVRPSNRHRWWHWRCWWRRQPIQWEQLLRLRRASRSPVSCRRRVSSAASDPQRLSESLRARPPPRQTMPGVSIVTASSLVYSSPSVCHSHRLVAAANCCGLADCRSAAAVTVPLPPRPTVPVGTLVRTDGRIISAHPSADAAAARAWQQQPRDADRLAGARAEWPIGRLKASKQTAAVSVRSPIVRIDRSQPTSRRTHRSAPAHSHIAHMSQVSASGGSGDTPRRRCQRPTPRRPLLC